MLLLLCTAALGCAPAAASKSSADDQESEKHVTAKISPVRPSSPAGPHDAWPVFRGDALSDGVARSALAERPALLWKHSVKDVMFESTPAIADGMVYLGGLDGDFYALNLASGDERWKVDAKPDFRAPAAVRDGRVYVGDTEGRFLCLDGKTGDALWGLSTGGEINAGANFYTARATDGGEEKDNVLIGSQDGTLYCLDAQSGDEVWKYTIENMIQCSPTIVENRVFIAGCDNVLHIIDVETGKRFAQVDIHDPTGVTPAAVGERVFFATQGSKVLCVDWRKAEIVWTYENSKRKSPYQSSPAVSQGIVVIGGRDRTLHGINAENGKELWTFPTKSSIDGSPVIVGDRVYVGGGDGRVYGLSLASGEKLWEYEAGGDFVGSPAVADGRLVIANGNGDVLCFGTKPKPR